MEACDKKKINGIRSVPATCQHDEFQIYVVCAHAAINEKLYNKNFSVPFD